MLVPAAAQEQLHCGAPSGRGTLISLHRNACAMPSTIKPRASAQSFTAARPILRAHLLVVRRLRRSCLPKLPAELQSELVQSGLGALTGASLNNNRDRLQRYIGDIGRGLYVILVAGLGVGVVASAAWLLLLRLAAGAMAWLTVAAANVLFAGCTVLCYQKVCWGPGEHSRQLGSSCPSIWRDNLDSVLFALLHTQPQWALSY